MEQEKEKTLDELRKMTYNELENHFHITSDVAQDLVVALNTKHYDILCNNDLTAKKMAKELGISYRTVNGYRFALLKVGLAEKKHEITPISNQLEVLLNKLTRPMSYEDLQKETGFSYNQISVYMRMLRHEKRADMFRLANNPDFFGELANKSYAFKLEQKNATVDLIIAHLPPFEEIRAKTLSTRLTAYLNQSKLPEKIFGEVYAYYARSGSPPKAVRKANDIAKSLFEKFEEIASGFGLDSKTPEDLADKIRILSELGFFKDNAYEINRIRFVDPDTGELEEGLEIRLSGGPEDKYTHVMSLLYSDVKSRKFSKYNRVRYDLLKVIQSAEKPPTNTDIRKMLGDRFEQESIYHAITSAKNVGLIEESTKGAYTLRQFGLEYITNHESGKRKKIS